MSQARETVVSDHYVEDRSVCKWRTTFFCFRPVEEFFIRMSMNTLFILKPELNVQTGGVAWCSLDNLVEVVVPGTDSSISLTNEVRANDKRGFKIDILPR